MQNNAVNAAFDLLIEEIERVVNELNEAGAQAIKNREYDKATRHTQQAARLAEFLERVEKLRKEWVSFPVVSRARRRAPTRVSDVRLSRGLRTPEDAFRQPILQTLVELGGTATAADVLDRVYEKMKSKLTEHDCLPLPSNPNCVRWRNTAQWCRLTLVKEGLMKRNSRYGVWEISYEGREWLRRKSARG
jgi:hypothetical protein